MFRVLGKGVSVGACSVLPILRLGAMVFAAATHATISRVGGLVIKDGFAAGLRKPAVGLGVAEVNLAAGELTEAASGSDFKVSAMELRGPVEVPHSEVEKQTGPLSAGLLATATAACDNSDREADVGDDKQVTEADLAATLVVGSSIKELSGEETDALRFFQSVADLVDHRGFNMRIKAGGDGFKSVGSKHVLSHVAEVGLHVRSRIFLSSEERTDPRGGSVCFCARHPLSYVEASEWNQMSAGDVLNLRKMPSGVVGQVSCVDLLVHVKVEKSAFLEVELQRRVAVAITGKERSWRPSSSPTRSPPNPSSSNGINEGWDAGVRGRESKRPCGKVKDLIFVKRGSVYDSLWQRHLLFSLRDDITVKRQFGGLFVYHHLLIMFLNFCENNQIQKTTMLFIQFGKSESIYHK
ncbi:hypothetical protein NE237_005210 [Protea cynaroides]|uniref:Uncharacterized protein n=1 Tax=Protea cynaroides TaxID=273540 RepID=A0A9Q0KKY2_9MAGN|nr:hypothetical protein NE237_005210 [Protea cynaroides]